MSCIYLVDSHTRSHRNKRSVHCLTLVKPYIYNPFSGEETKEEVERDDEDEDEDCVTASDGERVMKTLGGGWVCCNDVRSRMGQL